MKKTLIILLSASLLTSCSIKKEASDLYTRIADFITGDSLKVNDENNGNYIADRKIDIKTLDNGIVNLTVVDDQNQVVDVNLDQDTYEKYDTLIDYARDYIANNEVDINRLKSDKAYMMKHGLNFARIYDVDINSLSSEDLANLSNMLDQ